MVKSSDKCGIRALKDRLMEYREREREIDSQIERIENIKGKMIGLRSLEMSGMPHAQFATKDRLTKLLAQKEEVEKDVMRMIGIQESEKEWINSLLKHVKRADERACIRVRYIDVESWTQVAKILFGSNEDFYERKDSYLRRTTKIHGRALQQMAEWQGDQKG